MVRYTWQKAGLSSVISWAEHIYMLPVTNTQVQYLHLFAYMASLSSGFLQQILPYLTDE
jgi:hypothetical protein